MSTDMGWEDLPLLGLRQGQPGALDKIMFRQTRDRLIVSWRYRGKPHSDAETGFTLVKRHTREYIWHRPHGNFYCENSIARLCLGLIAGCRNPSHRLWLDDVIIDEVPQQETSEL
jgi:hypothetical protein